VNIEIIDKDAEARKEMRKKENEETDQKVEEVL
jgi:hypothetical protein